MRILFWSLLILLLLLGCNTSPNIPMLSESDTAVLPTPIEPSGTMYFVELRPGIQNLARYDVPTGRESLLFRVPDNGWLAGFDMSPDGAQFILAYAPPPEEGQIQFGFTNLYLMKNEAGSEPRLLIEPIDPQEVFFNPTWSPDGEYIYYSHVIPEDEEAYTFRTQLERFHLSSGEIESLAENAIWPQLSTNGSKLAYVTVTPDSLAQALLVADADGRNPTILVPQETFQAVDAPMFSLDGEWLYFSASENSAAVRPWWDWALGVQTAVAHNLPSDWYRTPLAGGEWDRLTDMGGTGFYGRFASHNAPYFAFSSQEGLFMMSPDGRDLEKRLNVALTDSLVWQP
ncbi:MAG: hypothetical protein GY796_33130 [Chloroflexi bacterium]|nr:hypothetical protein [Chloroflexota bacterium]